MTMISMLENVNVSFMILNLDAKERDKVQPPQSRCFDGGKIDP